MEQDSRTRGLASQHGKGPSWISGRSAALIIVILALGSAVAYLTLRRQDRPETASPTVAVAPSPEPLASVAESEAIAVSVQPGEIPLPTKPTGVFQSATREVAKPIPPPSLPEPTPQTRQLVKNLSQFDLSKGMVTPEQAAQWKQDFQQLVGQGAAAVPAIREFLEQNLDISFDAIPGGNSLGQASLRTALFDALKNIGGPEALELSLHILQSTAVPSEIAILAKNLEEQAPEQYRHLALEAVRQTLAQAAAGKLPGEDVRPLFEVLQKYGDASVLVDLETAANQWNYYAAMALAKLPDGAGVPGLVKLAQNPGNVSKGIHGVALQMLAQVSTEYPEAGAALVEQTRRNQIPSRLWPSIASTLTGEEFFWAATLLGNNPPDGTGPGVKTMHVAFGNQNFHSSSRMPSWSNEQIRQRLALMEQLLAANADSGAARALQDGRALLTGKLNK